MLLWAQVAFAHAQVGEAKGFLTGFTHPLSGLDHVLAMSPCLNWMVWMRHASFAADAQGQARLHDHE
jgi:hydrogenase/urease accessory protein HupE